MKVGCRDRDSEGEGGDLGEGVDAGVGAARALGENGFAGDAVEGLDECALNSGESGLDLPAVVGGSVVGECDLPVRHGLLWTVSRLGGMTVDREEELSGVDGCGSCHRKERGLIYLAHRV
jgi:hypothetical protein